MSLSHEQLDQIKTFFENSKFSEKGWVITDLDGTAIHEYQGRLALPESVQQGLKKIYDLGRPVVINTLRFPLSVMRTFGIEWYGISNASVPTILMNGSQLGYMAKASSDKFTYEEIIAFPLLAEEIREVTARIRQLVDGKVENLLVFHYPRDWQQGEKIWTPRAEKIAEVKEKYSSASTVFSGSLDDLESQLLSQDICMIFLLVDIPEDQLMAYQHTKKSNFFTHKGVDKLFGAQQMASYLKFDLASSVGAGDTEMDTFLKDVGLPIHVGPQNLSFKSASAPVKIKNSAELGEVLFQLAAMQRKSGS